MPTPSASTSPVMRPDEITRALDEVVAELDEAVEDEFVTTAARRTLSATEW